MAPLYDQYKSLCEEIAEALDDNALFSALMRDINMVGAYGLVGALFYTIKTRKLPGSVRPRPLHSAAAHPFRPLM